MPKLLLTQVDFKIRITSKEKYFEELRRLVYRVSSEKLGYPFSDKIDTGLTSPLELLVRSRLKKFKKSDDVLVFLTEYTEREGSFISAFTLFIFGAVTNYGSLRESMDYLRSDFEHIFGDGISRDINVNVEYSDFRNDDSIEKVRRVIEGPFQQFRKQVYFIAFFSLLALVLAGYAVYRVENPEQSLSKDEIQDVIHHEFSHFESQRRNVVTPAAPAESRRDTSRVRRR